MADASKLRDYRVKVEFWVTVKARHAVSAENQGWEGRLKLNGSKEITPEFVEVERLGEF